MQVNLFESKRTAINFLRAERQAEAARTAQSEEIWRRCQELMEKARTALVADPIAKAMLEKAQSYECDRMARLNAIESGTLLGTVSTTLEQVADGDITADPGMFKDSSIDDDWDRLCKALSGLNSEQASEVVDAVSNLFGSLITDLVHTELPPVPKFTI